MNRFRQLIGGLLALCLVWGLWSQPALADEYSQAGELTFVQNIQPGRANPFHACLQFRTTDEPDDLIFCSESDSMDKAFPWAGYTLTEYFGLFNSENRGTCAVAYSPSPYPKFTGYFKGLSCGGDRKQFQYGDTYSRPETACYIDRGQGGELTDVAAGTSPKFAVLPDQPATNRTGSPYVGSIWVVGGNINPPSGCSNGVTNFTFNQYRDSYSDPTLTPINVAFKNSSETALRYTVTDPDASSLISVEVAPETGDN